MSKFIDLDEGRKRELAWMAIAIGGSLAVANKKRRSENLKNLDIFRDKANAMTAEELDQAIAEFDSQFDNDFLKPKKGLGFKK